MEEVEGRTEVRRRPDAVAGGRAGPEDAGVREGRGMVAVRIRSGRSRRSPCRLAPTCCRAAAVPMEEAKIGSFPCHVGFAVGAEEWRC